MLPLCQELDLCLSPAEIFPAFLDEPYCLFLDSGMSPASLGRYSYISARPVAILRAKGDQYYLHQGESHRSGIGDPFRELQRLWRRRSLPALPDLPPFQGGWAGYFGYELGRHVETLPRTAVDDLVLPDLYVCLYDWVLAHDHLTGRTWLFADGGPEGDLQQANERLAWVRAKLDQRAVQRTAERSMGRASNHEIPWSGRPSRSSGRTLALREPIAPTAVPAVDVTAETAVPHLSLHAGFTHDAYLRAVEKAKEYIAAGDIYQVNLSQRFDVALPCDPWVLYSVLREINPAPYAAYLQFPKLRVLSASPEQFLRVAGGRVETRPIKGTRARGATPWLDRELAQELVRSTKDRAENLMIVDLLRNDLGRVCQIGSVAVPELFQLEQYPTVHHLVSTVVGQLPAEKDPIDLLRACFPGGSITGAPKIRAMEIIDEIEPTERGVYCGAIGYLGHDGCMNTSIVIRTMVERNGRVYFQVGGGIVADSDPESEYQETLDKAKALMMALRKVGSI